MAAQKTCLHESSKQTKLVSELGVKLEVKLDHCRPEKTSTFYNQKMSICREIVLSTLAALVGYKSGEPITCLDAFGATGVAGIQWKKHLVSKVDVTINELVPETVENIKYNCQLNGLSCSTKSGGVEVLQQDANVTMHLRQFDFINIDPYGSTVQFMQSCFRNLRHHGIAVLTSTDVAALFAKCPNVTVRNYSSHVIKTDYYKELAVRIVLAEAVRQAAKCNKGLEVLLSVALEHFVMVVVRVHRASRYADDCTPCVRKLLHCLMCEERVYHPKSHVPNENPVGLLTCHCNDNVSGAAIVDIGPVWTGPILNTQFLSSMLKNVKDLKLSQRLTSLLSTLIYESECPRSESHNSILQKEILNITTTQKVNDSKLDEKNSMDSSELVEANDNSTLTDNNLTGGDKNLGNFQIEDKSCGNNGPRKRENESEEGKADSKKCKVEEYRVDELQMPSFYYSLPHLKMASDYPKINKLVSLLQKEGYRASKTHFHNESIRTDATRDQLKKVILKFKK